MTQDANHASSQSVKSMVLLLFRCQSAQGQLLNESSRPCSMVDSQALDMRVSFRSQLSLDAVYNLRSMNSWEDQFVVNICEHPVVGLWL